MVAAPPKRKPPQKPTDVDPVTTYAQSVVDGETAAGKLVRQACERHLRDLVEGPERGLHFDTAAANKAIRFFGLLKHSKGEWAGKPLVLAPWQAFIIGSLLGWKRADGLRRFRVCYSEIPRKNGKSTIAAALGLLLAFFDGEPGAEVYAAATKRDQAKIVWSEGQRMVKATPDLRGVITVLVANLHSEQTASKFEPLGADTDGMDGLNIHGAIVDELHAHKSRTMWDVLATATGSRRQPLIFAITTAGVDRHSVCRAEHDYAVRVLDGIIEDDTYFAYVATIDEGDDWTDPAVWAKANPNLGVSVKLDDLQRKCEKAKAIAGEQNSFKRLHLNVWTEQTNRWIDLALWDKGAEPLDLEELRGRTCYGGLDLARVLDLSSLALVFPPETEGERWKVLMRYYLPEENMQERVRRDRVPYDQWVRDGLIETTSGNVTDFRYIKNDIVELAGIYNIREVAYDRTFAGELIQDLQEEGVTVVPFGQGFLSMASPTAELARLLLGEQVQHGGHAVLRWNAANVAVAQDAAGNLKPDKEKSTERIDGVVAFIMALGRASVNKGDGRSVYETRGIRTFG